MATGYAIRDVIASVKFSLAERLPINQRISSLQLVKIPLFTTKSDGMCPRLAWRNMASSTPFSFCTTRKRLMAILEDISMACQVVPLIAL